MKMDDDDLALLGYGNQWEETTLKLAKDRKAWLEENNPSSLERVEKRHRENPQEHLDAIRRWRKKNPDKVKAQNERRESSNLIRFGFLIGKKCLYCKASEYTRKDIASGSWKCRSCKKGSKND